MTTKPDVAALIALLPEVEGAGERLEDETIGRVICALHGWFFLYAAFEQGQLRVGYGASPQNELRYWYADRYRCPDVDLTAADALCRELGFDRESGRSFNMGWAIVFKPGWRDNYPAVSNPTSEPLAILASLMKAVISEAEAQ